MITTATHVRTAACTPAICAIEHAMQFDALLHDAHAPAAPVAVKLVVFAPMRDHRSFAYIDAIYSGGAVGHVAKTRHPETPYVGHAYHDGAMDTHSEGFHTVGAARAWVEANI